MLMGARKSAGLTFTPNMLDEWKDVFVEAKLFGGILVVGEVQTRILGTSGYKIGDQWVWANEIDSIRPLSKGEIEAHKASNRSLFGTYPLV